MMMDFHACSWPEPRLNAQDTSLAEFFDAMNDEPLQPVFDALNNGAGGGAAACGTETTADADGAAADGNGAHVTASSEPDRPVVISFSHFLPYQVQRLRPNSTNMWSRSAACSVFTQPGI